MNKNLLLSVFTAAALSFTGLAVAQDRDGRQGRGDGQQTMKQRPGGDDRQAGQQNRGRNMQVGDDRRHDRRAQRGYDSRRGQWQARGHRAGRAYNRGQYRGHYRAYGYRQAPRGFYTGRRGAGPNHDFYRGRRLSREYRNNYYTVNDWRGHRLSPPPRGYRWVQTGNDYVLAALTTGLILQVVLGN